MSTTELVPFPSPAGVVSNRKNVICEKCTFYGDHNQPNQCAFCGLPVELKIYEEDCSTSDEGPITELVPFPPPAGVVLKHTNRKNLVCEKCTFYGDQIYFNQPNQCAFCELPAELKLYGEDLIARTSGPSPGPGLGRLGPGGNVQNRHILSVKDLDRLPVIRKAMIERDLIVTIRVVGVGRCMIEIYGFIVTDD